MKPENSGRRTGGPTSSEGSINLLLNELKEHLKLSSPNLMCLKKTDFLEIAIF